MAGSEASSADFGPIGGPAEFAIRCRQADRTIQFWRRGARAGALVITVSDGDRSFPSNPATDGAEAILPAADGFLDRLAFSRGRFEVVVPGMPPLIVPAWAEPARVIEDCRG